MNYIIYIAMGVIIGIAWMKIAKVFLFEDEEMDRGEKSILVLIGLLCAILWPQALIFLLLIGVSIGVSYLFDKLLDIL